MPRTCEDARLGESDLVVRFHRGAHSRREKSEVKHRSSETPRNCGAEGIAHVAGTQAPLDREAWREEAQLMEASA